tara:strand:+ start:300 stop:1100 length:801 start_codon:yes stop_codon:yes gene_type:complete
MGKQKRIILEYVWCDSTGVSSKTMIIPISIANPKSWDIKNDVSWIPQWNVTINYDVNKKLIPSYWCMDPFRMKIVNDSVCVIVLCNTDERNFEYEQVKANMKKNNTDKKLISITQNYMINIKSQPTHNMSKIAEQHLWLCIEAGLNISEVNINKHPHAPSYKIGLCKGIDVANQLTLSKYIMERLIREKYSSHTIYWTSGLHNAGCFISYVGESDTAQYYHNQKDGWHYNLQKSIQQLTIPMLQSKYKSRLYNSPYDALNDIHNVN